MDILASGTSRRFRSLLDAAAADHVGSRPSTAADRMGPATSGLGPSVGDDGPGAPSVTTLGPSVGDNVTGNPRVPALTMLGPSVGDDNTGGSDLRLKEDVRCVGTTVFGLPLYHFKYVGQPETYEGVMAHEVLQVMPDAVSRGADGYYRVNYGALGTSMRRVS